MNGFKGLNQHWLRYFFAGVLLCLAGFSQSIHAQDLTPRRWNHIPVDTNFGVAGYIYTEADIFFDPVLKVEDAELEMQTYLIGYLRSFEWFGKTARFEMAQAYHVGEWNGLLDGVATEVNREGCADALVRLAVDLYGAPPLKGEEYARYRKAVHDCETLVGAAVVLQLPTGDYNDDKLINLGANRFTIRPQCGVLHQRGKWAYETTVSAWIYTDNDDFWKDTRREQSTLYSAQAHATYTLRPGVWLSGGVGYGWGGENWIDGAAKDDEVSNFLWALTVGYSWTPQAGVKLSYLVADSQNDTGLDGTSLALGFSYVW